MSELVVSAAGGMAGVGADTEADVDVDENVGEDVDEVDGEIVGEIEGFGDEETRVSACSALASSCRPSGVCSGGKVFPYCCCCTTCVSSWASIWRDLSEISGVVPGMCIAPSWVKASAFNAWAFLSTAAPRCKATDVGLVPATAETAARTSADTACCFGAGACPKDLMLSLVMVAVSLGESRRAVGNSDCRDGAAIGVDATAAVAVDTNGVPDARRCTPVVGVDVDMLELGALELGALELVVLELVVLELDKLLCWPSALALAGTEVPVVTDGACAFGVSGTCSDSWSRVGDGSSTLVDGETGALVGAASLAVEGAVGAVARVITGEAGEVVDANCAVGVLVVGAWVRAISSGAGESERGALETFVLATAELVTGVLVGGVLATAALGTGELVVGAWVRALSAGSGESERGALETFVLATGVLVTGVLVVGAWVRALSAGSGESERGALETDALATAALVTGVLVVGAWVRALSAGSGESERGVLATGVLATGVLVEGA